MKVATTAGFVVSICLFMMTVAGAMESRAQAARGRIERAQELDAAAGRHAAGRDHASAACCYTRAATKYRLQARIQRRKGDNAAAASYYWKACAMHAAAGEQEIMHLLSVLTDCLALSSREQVFFVLLMADYAKMGHYQEQGFMQEGVAFCYSDMAEDFVYASQWRLAWTMSWAAAERHEASAHCALLCRDREYAAIAYSRAAEDYKEAGDWYKAQSMERAEAEQLAVLSVEQAACGDLAGAVVSLHCAARGYGAIGRPDKVRSVNEAIVRLHEDSTARPALKSDRWHAVHYHCYVADAYEALGQPEVAVPLRRTAAESYEAMAIALQRKKNRLGAYTFYVDAAKMYKKIGDHVRAFAVRNIANRLGRR